MAREHPFEGNYWPAKTNTQSTENHQEGHPWTRTSWLPVKADRPKHGGLTSLWWCVAESRTEWPKEMEWMSTTKPGFSLAAGKPCYQWAQRGRWEESSPKNFFVSVLFFRFFVLSVVLWRDGDVRAQCAAPGNVDESLQAWGREPKGRYLDERYSQTRMAEELNRPTGEHAR